MAVKPQITVHEYASELQEGKAAQIIRMKVGDTDITVRMDAGNNLFVDAKNTAGEDHTAAPDRHVNIGIGKPGIKIPDVPEIKIPDVPHSKTVSFRTVNGHFLCVGGDGRLAADCRTGDGAALFEFELIGSSQIVLKAANGKYVSAVDGGGRELVANRDKVTPSETFTVVRRGGTVALQAANGLFVSPQQGGGGAVLANGPAFDSWEALTSSPRVPNGSGPLPVSGRMIVDSRRFRDDNGWFPWRGISDFAVVALLLQGREAEVVARFDVYAAAQRTVVRIMGMLGHSSWQALGLAFSPDSPQYWDALDRVVTLANSRGLRVELCCFADAQVVVPDANRRREWMRRFAAFIRERPGVIPQVANEPFKNGWSEADDPALLELAEILAGELGHRDFSIGDPMDGDDADASAETTAKLVTLATRANISVLHSSRKEDADRYRRWVDHLEGITDVLAKLRAGVAFVHDEPMGAGPVRAHGTRDIDPDAFVAAQMTAACCGLGYTYHWRPEEGVAVEQLPGLLSSAFLADVPCSPDWRYLNDSWAGSPTRGVRTIGKPGKIRSLVNGNRAWTLAYGELDYDSIVWLPEFSARELVYNGACAKVWKINQ